MFEIDSIMTAYLSIPAAAAGAAGGCFINSLARRMAHGEKQPWRGRMAGVFMAVWSVALLWRFGVSFSYGYYLGFSFLLLAEGLVDFETYEIPDRFHAAAVLWWCLFLPLQKDHLLSYLADSLAGGLLIGGGLLAASLIFDKAAGRESLGGGDIKLFFVTGLYLGFAVNLLNVIVSCFFGLILAAATAGRRKDKEDPAAVPFGPAIGAGTGFCILAGRALVNWYLGFFL